MQPATTVILVQSMMFVPMVYVQARQKIVTMATLAPPIIVILPRECVCIPIIQIHVMMAMHALPETFVLTGFVMDRQ
jgi:hypothetical protein